jgi:hypothetical protein
MTFFGKFLAFVNLVVGLGLLSWSVSVYVDRPMWFEQIPPAEGVDKGNDPVTFAQLKADIDSLARAADVKSGTWGARLKELEALEALRADRLKGYAERLKWAREGNPKDGGNAFYEPVLVESDGMKLIDLSAKGEPIRGVNNLPLKGADTLLKSFSADVAKVAEMSQAVEKQRKAFGELGVRILATEERLNKMNVIRDSVQNELFYLATFEINVYETRETVFRRQRQLVQRLAELGVPVRP